MEHKNRIQAKDIITIVLFSMTALLCSGQSFISDYHKLSRRKLDKFCMEWRSYSDSVEANRVVRDSVLADVVEREYGICWYENSMDQSESLHKYRVLPQFIYVERYFEDVDSLGFTSDFENSAYCVIDSITPVLPEGGLYMNSNIYKPLSVFLGGLLKNDEFTKIHFGNLKKLQKYIPVNYGHWGGYWLFMSFPSIIHIKYANNAIKIVERMSWHSGVCIMYKKKDGKFVRRNAPVSYWNE